MYDEFDDNELYAHKRSDKVKWVISFLLIFVLLAGLIGAWVMLLKPEEPVPEQEEGGAVISAGENSGISLKSMKIPAAQYAEYGISPMADTAYQLTATVMPENATDKTVDWTVDWTAPPHSGTNIHSVAARDISYTIEGGQQHSGGSTQGNTTEVPVTDYVTVTPTSDGALTANVECFKAFGTKIKVTVTSRDNPNAKANCTVDYAQKLQGVKATFGSTVLTDGMTKTFDLSQSGQGAESWKFDYTASACTIADEYTTTVKISFTENASGIGNTIGAVLTWDQEDITAGMPAFDKTFFDRVFKDAMGGAVSDDPAKFNKLVTALTGNPSDPGTMLFEVEVKTVGAYGSKTDVYQIKVMPDGLNIRVEDVELDDTSIIF